VHSSRGTCVVCIGLFGALRAGSEYKRRAADMVFDVLHVIYAHLY
jgi:hypothetical protein